MLSLFKLLFCALLASHTLAVQLYLTTPANLPPLPPSTRALLTQQSNPHISVPVTTNNAFLFCNLTAGAYDLAIACRDYDFEREYAVEIDDAGKIGVFKFGYYGTGAKTRVKTGLEYLALEVKAVRRKEFYEERVGFSPLSLLKNPMILIAVVGLAFVVGMPYLLDSMDPEMRAEFEEQQKKSVLSGGANTANPLQNFDMAAWMAGKTSSGDAISSSKDVEDERGGASRRRRG